MCAKTDNYYKMRLLEKIAEDVDANWMWPMYCCVCGSDTISYIAGAHGEGKKFCKACAIDFVNLVENIDFVEKPNAD